MLRSKLKLDALKMIITTMIAADIITVVDVEAVDAIIKTIVVTVIAIPTQMMMVAGPKKTVTMT